MKEEKHDGVRRGKKFASHNMRTTCMSPDRWTNGRVGDLWARKGQVVIKRIKIIEYFVSSKLGLYLFTIRSRGWVV